MLKDRRVKTGGFCKGLKLFKAELCIANGETGLNLLLVIPDFFFFFFYDGNVFIRMSAKNKDKIRQGRETNWRGGDLALLRQTHCPPS